MKRFWSIIGLLAGLAVLVAAYWFFSTGTDFDYPLDETPSVSYLPAVPAQWSSDRTILPDYDIYEPDGKASAIIILIHGGGGVKGDKAGCAAIATRFAARGFRVVNTNYSVAPAFPAAPNQIANLIGRFAGNRPVFVIGHSAGVWVAECAVAQYPKLVAGIVSVAGIHDPSAYARIGPRRLHVTERALGQCLIQEASPIRLVTAAYPPVLLIHASGDSVVPVAQSIRFARHIRNLGVDVQLWHPETQGHEWPTALESAIAQWVQRHTPRRVFCLASN